MIKIGLTGGIGSGKTIVAKIFSSLGIPVYNADIESKIITNTDKKVKNQLTRLFGSDIYEGDWLNKKKFASLIFGDKKKLKAANEIIHPAVAFHFDNWLKNNRKAIYIIKEAAILFESGSYKELDKIITVFSPKELRVQRVMERQQVTRERVLEIMNKQLPEEEKLKRADHVIYNDEKQLVIPQALQLHEIFLQA